MCSAGHWATATARGAARRKFTEPMLQDETVRRARAHRIYLVAQEYSIPGAHVKGQGDLIFFDHTLRMFIVIETKLLGAHRGERARERRRASAHKQALRYGCLFRYQFPHCTHHVVAAVMTEEGLEIVSSGIALADAAAFVRTREATAPTQFPGSPLDKWMYRTRQT